MKKEKLMNLAGVLLFYVIIVLGVVLVNARFEQMEQTNSSVTLSK